MITLIGNKGCKLCKVARTKLLTSKFVLSGERIEFDYEGKWSESDGIHRYKIVEEMSMNNSSYPFVIYNDKVYSWDDFEKEILEDGV